ncbi:argJ family protein [Hirsutella rhossiliensis]|uniref:Arginine biosynthesis bifunctional protein ArgJ, mitochondrial n=1 Tax=Hirsutella rhossiliensis TaxID=111463 RepID=A0A9P8N234_9HYPO|nr:argJ family domain-containing protein [Hirsutella rhossiliensis]KAH0965197.1 argJ family domain-containing protein [Hirsutella rhossiliensis]
MKSVRRAYASSLNGTWPASKAKYVPTSGTYPKGYTAAGVFVGIKHGNTDKLDLALLSSDRPAAAAAVFTKNKFQAAPVTFSRRLLDARANTGLRSVIVNSGCANAVTGTGGLEDAAAMASTTDRHVGAPDSTIVMSTGVIGQRLPIAKIVDHIPVAYLKAGDSHQHWLDCATAICTTDTFPKLMSRSFKLPSSPGVEYRIAGMTKGAGMLAPNMATLLTILATDAPIAPGIMRSVLQQAVDCSFNSITIDGDTSTNDTVALLANGAAGGTEVTSEQSEDGRAFSGMLTDFAADLAKYIVRDGEGATKFVTIRVVDCASLDSARTIARSIARSPLVKTALYGNDANWGRILCAAGYALISPPGHLVNDVPEIVPERTSVSFIPTDGSQELKLLVNGEPEEVNEARAGQIVQATDLEILVKLGTGDKSAVHWTCDISHDYVTINGDYRT